MNVCIDCGSSENLHRHHKKNQKSNLHKFRWNKFLNSEYNQSTDLIGNERVEFGKKNWKLFINDKELQKNINFEYKNENKEYFEFKDDDIVYLCNRCHATEHSTGEFIGKRTQLKQVLYQEYDCKRIEIIKKYNLQKIKENIGTGKTVWSGSSTPLHYAGDTCIGFRYYCSVGCSVEECKEYHHRDFEMTDDVYKELYELYLWLIAERTAINDA